MWYRGVWYRGLSGGVCLGDFCPGESVYLEGMSAYLEGVSAEAPGVDTPLLKCILVFFQLVGRFCGLWRNMLYRAFNRVYCV